MILVTTGTQEPFDRLIKSIDEIAPSLEGEKLVVQALSLNYSPKNFSLINYINPIEFDQLFNEANFIISHAGMGSIINALEKQKLIFVLPRIAKLKEHRNEHQLATANKFKNLENIKVANDENDLKKLILDRENFKKSSTSKLGQYASKELVNSLFQFINS